MKGVSWSREDVRLSGKISEGLVKIADRPGKVSFGLRKVSYRLSKV